MVYEHMHCRDQVCFGYIERVDPDDDFITLVVRKNIVLGNIEDWER